MGHDFGFVGKSVEAEKKMAEYAVVCIPPFSLY